MLNYLEQFSRDVRFGLRSLGTTPGSAALATISLALGIMATTAIYSVVHAVVLDPFPYKDIDKLMSIRVWEPGGRFGRIYYTTDQFLEIAERSTIFEGVIASTITDVLWTGNGDPQRLRGNHGPFNTFQVMGVPPLLGRTPGADDAKPGAAPVVVLGYKFWQRQFGGDPAVVGRPLRLDDTVRTVIGVMPKRFMWRGADVYVPIVFEHGRAVAGVRSVHVLGRLKPGVTEAQAEADLRPIIADLKNKEPAQFSDNWRVGLLSFKESFPSDIGEALWLLFGAVGLLLAIACANVSNLLLSKAAVRQREMAVRAALGASRSRLVRQLLTESLILALAGGVLGVALAYGGLQAILALVPPDTIPDESEVALNSPVLIFTLFVSALTSVICGLAPALHICGRDLANPLREATRGLAGGARQAILRKSFVVVEVALSLVLLVGAGLMIRTFVAMQNVDLGIRVDRLLTMRLPLSERRYPTPDRRIAFLQELLRRVSAVPGAAAVGLNTGLHPIGSSGWPVEIEGSAQQSAQPVLVHQINPTYTRAFGIGLAGGRLFTENEVSSRQHLALVNQSLARKQLHGQEAALGRIIRIPRWTQPPFALSDAGFQIVGVVKDTMNRTISTEVLPEVYVPYTVLGIADRLVVLTQANPASMARAVTSQVYGVDKDQPVTEVQTIDRILQQYFYAGPRFNLALFSVFAVLGLVLAVVGVYGVMSSSVAQQTHEIGVRMALGANSGAIAGMIIKRGATLLLVGIALGFATSVATARLLASQIWNVSPFDPMAFGAVSLILLAAGLQACVWPARRAARIDPVTALRTE
jgi:putative ABC transport system permease protein